MTRWGMACARSSSRSPKGECGMRRPRPTASAMKIADGVPLGGPPSDPVAVLELVGQTKLGLGATVVEPAEAPSLEDRRATALRGDEVTLGDVDDEIVADHVVDGPERLHAPLVHPVDCHSGHRHDAAAAVEGEGGEREDALPVADL